MSGFEGSFLGEKNRIGPHAVLECGVCWWVYDPALGDASWQIPAGTAFADLPEHWRCPNCDTAQAQFMVVAPGARAASAAHARPAANAGLRCLAERSAELQRAYAEVAQRMRRLPVYNQRLDIRVIGLRRWREGIAGVVTTPWAMNILLLPAAADSVPLEGSEREVRFPSGVYRFVSGRLAGVGPVETCSLFSPMQDFDDAEVAAEVARHAVEELFREPRPVPAGAAISRRDFLRGGREGPGAVSHS